MKKLLSILCLFALALGALPVFAEETEAPAATAEPALEIVFSYYRMFIELSANDPEGTNEAREALAGTPGVAYVEENSPYGYVFDRDVTRCVYWTVVFHEPYEAGFRAARNKLEGCPAVLRITQTAQCLLPDGGRDNMHVIMLCTDIPDTDEARVNAVKEEISALPGVQECRDNGIGMGHLADETMLFFVTIREPLGANYPSVLEYLRAQPYYKGRIVDPAAGRPPVEYAYGDADLDQQVTAADARAILRAAVGLDSPETYLQFVLCDMDADGEITSADARKALRAAVELDPKNTYTYYPVQYAGLIAGASVSLSKTEGGLALTASTVGGVGATKCGFEYIKLQKKENGVWTDVRNAQWTAQYSTGGSALFSKTVSGVTAGEYRLVCLHYAEAPYGKDSVRAARFFSVSAAVNAP